MFAIENRPKKFLWLKNLKTLCRGCRLIERLKVKKLLEGFFEKIIAKINQTELRIDKVINYKKVIN